MTPTTSTLLRYAVPPALVTAAVATTLLLGADAPFVEYPLLFAIVAFGCASLVITLLLASRAQLAGERNALDLAVGVERERLESVLDSAQIGIGFLDADLRYLQVNEALADINRVPAREHLGRRVAEIAPWVPEGILTTLRAVLEGKPSIGLDVAIDDARFSSEPRHFVASFLPLRGSTDSVVGVGFTVHEVTAMKRFESAQALLRTRAEEAQRAADAANHMKDEFLATLSHEMRSPLQALLGWSQLLRRGRLDTKQEDHAFETIERIVRQQADLLNGLFDVSRIMAGKMELELSSIDLSEVARQAFEDKQFSAKRHGITMTCDAAMPISVSGDPERIHQILGNLLTNAIKFTPTGGCVELRCFNEAGEGVITVRDTGEGVPPEFIQHIFERFSQTDRSRGRRHSGLGLGLSIVYHLVELHGGRVTADSPGPGRGTTMTVRLPLPLALPPAGSPTASPTASPAPVIPRVLLPGIRVLLVEDDVNVRESTAAFLEMRAAHVTVATTALAGVEAFQHSKPDVVVSDLGLPGEDGYALLQQIRALETGRDVPVIAFSGYSSPPERARCIAAGFTAHLIKPVHPDALVLAIAAALVPDPELT